MAREAEANGRTLIAGGESVANAKAGRKTVEAEFLKGKSAKKETIGGIVQAAESGTEKIRTEVASLDALAKEASNRAKEKGATPATVEADKASQKALADANTELKAAESFLKDLKGQETRLNPPAAEPTVHVIPTPSSEPAAAPAPAAPAKPAEKALTPDQLTFKKVKEEAASHVKVEDPAQAHDHYLACAQARSALNNDS